MAGLHLFRCAHAQQVQAVGNHLAYCQVKAHTGVPQGSVFNQHLVGVVVGVELAGQLTQVVGEVVRLALGGGVGNQLRILASWLASSFSSSRVSRLKSPTHSFRPRCTPSAASLRSTLQIRAWAY